MFCGIEFGLFDCVGGYVSICVVEWLGGCVCIVLGNCCYVVGIGGYVEVFGLV